MGLFDLPAPIFGVIDGLLALALPAVLRLVIWGIFAGWLTMVVYRFLSNQEKIGELKTLQKTQQKNIAEFDGEFGELLPLIRHTIALGFKQLGFALGPALLATVPILFIVFWIAGEYGHEMPASGNEVFLSVEPATREIHWSPKAEVKISEGGWTVNWPEKGQTLTMSDDRQALLVLPLENEIPILHKKRWWNILLANPLGYLPDDGTTDVINIDLPEFIVFESGPAWIRGWMFSFFMSLLLSSLGFKLLLRID